MSIKRMDDRGSSIVTVMIAMAFIGILATTVLWASYLNYRMKVNNLRAKNSFYAAETAVEQIVTGIKKDVVSTSINKAYGEVINNWDALGTDANRESYFASAYIESVEEKLSVESKGATARYDKDRLRGYVDADFWKEDNPDGYIQESAWNDAIPEFIPACADNDYRSMLIKNIHIEFYDSNDYLSIIHTDLAIDVPRLSFTQAETIDRLYPYVLIGGTGIECADAVAVTIDGSIYGGVDEDKKGGIQIGENSSVTIENAAYIISGGDVIVGNDPYCAALIHQGADLVVKDVDQTGTGFRTNIYARGLILNGSRLDMAGRMYIANDLILSGSGSKVSLTGQYYGYGNTNTLAGKGQEDSFVDNPADSSSAILINGRDSTVDLTGLTVLQLAGRAYVGLPGEEADNGLPHVLMGESISVKSNQIAYLVPPECVGTMDGSTVIGQNPVPFDTWSRMIGSPAKYKERDFKIVDADKSVYGLGGECLGSYGIENIMPDDLSGVDTMDIVHTVTKLNQSAALKGVRFLYMPEEQQVYLYLVMDERHATQYFARYYHVDSNKVRLDRYFNQYVPGGIKVNDNAPGYMVVGNSMVSATDASAGDIATSMDGQNLVRLLPGSLIENGDVENNTEDDGDTTDPWNDAAREKLEENAADYGRFYENLSRNLLEEDPGTEDTVFENLVRLHTWPGSPEGMDGLQEYLDEYDGKVEFTTGESADVLKAVLVDANREPGSVYQVSDSGLRLVIAIGNVEVTKNFQGLIIASGKITIADSVTVKQDREGVYAVLYAKSEIDGDGNVPADILCHGPGMNTGGYEVSDVDEEGNLNIDYSRIVRYENWTKK